MIEAALPEVGAKTEMHPQFGGAFLLDRACSVVVPMPVVCRVPVAVVDVVDVVAVGNRDMPTALAVRVSVVGVLLVPTVLALVRVPFVPTVQVTVVHVVDVVAMGNSHVPAAFAVHVIVSGVGPVLKGCCHAVHLHRSGRSTDEATMVDLSAFLPPRERMPPSTRACKRATDHHGYRKRFP